MNPRLICTLLLPGILFAALLNGQEVTYFPYLQPGDNGPLSLDSEVKLGQEHASL